MHITHTQDAHRGYNPSGGFFLSYSILLLHISSRLIRSSLPVCLTVRVRLFVCVCVCVCVCMCVCVCAWHRTPIKHLTDQASYICTVWTHTHTFAFSLWLDTQSNLCLLSGASSSLYTEGGCLNGNVRKNDGITVSSRIVFKFQRHWLAFNVRKT